MRLRSPGTDADSDLLIADRTAAAKVQNANERDCGGRALVRMEEEERVVSTSQCNGNRSQGEKLASSLEERRLRVGTSSQKKRIWCWCWLQLRMVCGNRQWQGSGQSNPDGALDEHKRN